jgi:hypothetical protein
MANLAARLGPRCLVAAVVTVSVLAFGGPASADFVGLLLQGSLQVTSYTCNPNGTSTVAFVASGQSQARYPGTFTATGTFTLDAQTQPGYFDDNFLPVGTLLSWSESFEIDSGSSVITGTSNSVAVPPPGFQISGATINTGVCAFEQNVTLGQVTNATGTVIQVYGTVGAHASGASVPTGTFASSVAVELLIQSSSIGPFQASSFAQAFFCCTTTPDPEPPVVSVTSPAEGAAFLLGQPVAADYSCNARPGSLDLMSCLGDVPSGQLIDTATDGAKTFTVTARDFAGLEPGARVVLTAGRRTGTPGATNLVMVREFP